MIENTEEKLNFNFHTYILVSLLFLMFDSKQNTGLNLEDRKFL